MSDSEPSEGPVARPTAAGHPSRRTFRRPDGGMLIVGAGTLAGLGALVLFFGMIVDPVERDILGQVTGVDGGKAALRFWLLAGGAGALQVALMLGIAGAIVRAIWFLPGEEEKLEPWQ